MIWRAGGRKLSCKQAFIGFSDHKKAFQNGKAFGKRETGFEPATLALARRYSTTEPLAHLLSFVSVPSNRSYDTRKSDICQQLSKKNILNIKFTQFNRSREVPTFCTKNKNREQQVHGKPVREKSYNGRNWLKPGGTNGCSALGCMVKCVM